MTAMESIALVSGIIVGVLSGIKLLDHSLLIFFHRNFLFGDSYQVLYDQLDNEANFEMMRNQPRPPKTYAEFLRLHEKHSENAIRDFRVIVHDVYRYLMVGYGTVLVLTVLFWSNWYWYLFGVFVAVTVQVLYRLVVNEHRRGFYVTLMLLTILNKR